MDVGKSHTFVFLFCPNYIQLFENVPSLPTWSKVDVQDCSDGIRVDQATGRGFSF